MYSVIFSLNLILSVALNAKEINGNLQFSSITDFSCDAMYLEFSEMNASFVFSVIFKKYHLSTSIRLLTALGFTL